jgi:hypothetical protein
MKFEKPENSNYCATAVKIRNIIPLQNCDNVVATTIFGFQAIIGKDVEIGTLGIVFPVETQLSDEFVSNNNLYRHEEYNKEPKKKGYLEDNRRVKAIKFRGHTSNALFMSLDCLSYLGIDLDNLKEGDEFDKIDGKEICKKYVVPTRSNGKVNEPPAKKFVRVDKLYMPEHFSTDNYFRNDRNIDPEQEIIVTQKLHGTSIRIGNTIVKRKLNVFEKVLGLLGVKIEKTEFDYVFGSRKVIKDVNNQNQQHYYETDIWTTQGKKLEGLVPENFLVYGELIGWTPNNAPIQTNYTYNLPQGEAQLYIYRVAFVNEKGLVVDLGWDQVKEFCFQRGLNTVPEVFRGRHKDFNAQQFVDRRLKDIAPACVHLSDPEGIDEGVCIRVDHIVPQIYKAKGPKFFEHETALLDKGEVDLETLETVTI